MPIPLQIAIEFFYQSAKILPNLVTLLSNQSVGQTMGPWTRGQTDHQLDVFS